MNILLVLNILTTIHKHFNKICLSNYINTHHNDYKEFQKKFTKNTAY